MTILKFEKEYRKCLLDQYNQLFSIYNNIQLNPNKLFKHPDITKAILLRMKSFYDTQYSIKNLLNKKYIPAAADFFVEAVLFYLQIVNNTFDKNFEIFSEKQIKPRRGSIRPDISIWKNGSVVSIIECKTQLGWDRGGWEENFKEREMKLKKDYPNAEAFLVIMTAINWKGIPEDNKKAGIKYFVLSKVWPPNITDDDLDSIIIYPIENLFKKLFQS